MDWKDLLPIAVSLGAAFTVMLVVRAVFKTAITVLRLVFFLAVAAAIYVFLFNPDADPGALFGQVFRAVFGK